MTDGEKVVEAFRECLCYDHNYCSDCYQHGPGLGFVCRNNVCLDVLNMLKEREAVEPRVSTAEQRCGNCNKVIEMDGWKTCPWCGKPIDWEGWWKKNGTRN